MEMEMEMEMGTHIIDGYGFGVMLSAAEFKQEIPFAFSFSAGSSCSTPPYLPRVPVCLYEDMRRERERERERERDWSRAELGSHGFLLPFMRCYSGPK
jgi:hypothetical protein